MTLLKNYSRFRPGHLHKIRDEYNSTVTKRLIGWLRGYPRWAEVAAADRYVTTRAARYQRTSRDLPPGGSVRGLEFQDFYSFDARIFAERHGAYIPTDVRLFIADERYSLIDTVYDRTRDCIARHLQTWITQRRVSARLRKKLSSIRGRLHSRTARPCKNRGLINGLYTWIRRKRRRIQNNLIESGRIPTAFFCAQTARRAASLQAFADMTLNSIDTEINILSREIIK